MRTIPIKYNVRSLWQRRGRNAMVIIGIALIVTIFMIMMAMADGVLSGWQAGGLDNNIVILQRGALYLESSLMPKQALNVISYFPDIGQNDGTPLVSPEVLITAWLKKGARDKEQSVSVRGIYPVALAVHNGVRIVAGDKPRRGGKIMIGKAVPFRLGAKLGLGDDVIMLRETWEVVGIFESPDSVIESEIWADLDDIMRAADRNAYSGVTLKVNTISNLKSVCDTLNNNRQISVRALPEKQYYAETGSMFSGMRKMGFLITLVAAVGAILGGMNAMYTSLAGRLYEVGVLMALGFSKSKILISFIIEFLMLSLTGGALGILLALPINGAPLPIMDYVFHFKITFKTVLQGIALAFALGVFGGYLPARWGAQRTVVEALRQK